MQEYLVENERKKRDTITRDSKNTCITSLVGQTLQQSVTNVSFLESIWDEDTKGNRHAAVPNLESLPMTVQEKHFLMFGYLKFFQTTLKPMLAEFIATWMLVFWACMLQPPPAGRLADGAFSNITETVSANGNLDALVPALAAGINLVIIICMFWDICVIQFNPCVTAALVMAGVIPARLLIPNILSQMGGAALAAYMAFWLRGYPVGMIPITDDSNLQAIFWSEFLFSFMMTFVAVMAILDPDFHHPLTPLIIGLTVTQGVFGGRYIGAGCMNPARVFGPACVTMDWKYHWIWWVSEIMGACFSVVMEAMIFAPIVVKGDMSKTSLWWWRMFLYRNGFSQGTDRKREFTSWNAAINDTRLNTHNSLFSAGMPRMQCGDEEVDDVLMYFCLSAIPIGLAPVTNKMESKKLHDELVTIAQRGRTENIF